MNKLLCSLLISAATFAVTIPALQGAIVLDNSDSVASNTTLSGFSVGNGSNRMLVALFTTEGNPTVTDISYGGNSFFSNLAVKNDANFKKSYIFYLPNPTTGSADLTVSMSATDSDTALAAFSLENVVQSGPFATANDAAAGAGTDTSGVNLPITTQNDNSWVFQSLMINDGSTISADSGQTVEFNADVGSAVSALGYQSIANAGSTTVDWSWSPDNTYTIAAAEFAAIPEPSTNLLLVLAGVTGLLIQRRRS